jgi:hypothetical protein
VCINCHKKCQMPPNAHCCCTMQHVVGVKHHLKPSTGSAAAPGRARYGSCSLACCPSSNARVEGFVVCAANEHSVLIGSLSKVWLNLAPKVGEGGRRAGGVHRRLVQQHCACTVMVLHVPIMGSCFSTYDSTKQLAAAHIMCGYGTRNLHLCCTTHHVLKYSGRISNGFMAAMRLALHTPATGLICMASWQPQLNAGVGCLYVQNCTILRACCSSASMWIHIQGSSLSTSGYLQYRNMIHLCNRLV